MKNPGNGTVRARLLRALALASELEHGLCLQYLFTALSLKTGLEEGGLQLAELNIVRKWRGTLFFIAAQEMLHLAQAANIAAALGSGLHIDRPNFPQRPSYYPTGLPWGLWPMSPSVLVLYALYERPSDSGEKASPAWLPETGQLQAQHAMAFWQDAPGLKDPFAHLPEHFDRPAASPHLSIAALYQQIAEDLRELGQAGFVGPAGAQVGPDLMDMPQLLPILTLQQALDGVRLITLQGEGSPIDRVDSHFGLFVRMYEEYQSLRDARPEFAPVRDVQSNPLSRLHVDNTYPGWRLIQDPLTRHVNDLCSGVYVLMLDALQQVFSDPRGDKAWQARMADLSLRLMTTVLAPLGDMLTRLPMGDVSPGAAQRAKCAGPSFELDAVRAPIAHGEAAWPAFRAALLMWSEEALQLAERCKTHEAHLWAATPLSAVAATLVEMTAP
ncbi:ferritin-like domain-containing protein [Paucibacter sp. XJ19-41]|uniref:ferritin-like domain-containing protein n=1 Tax=Paucibacter sp. XJ19-41 TaxID=2927824 RepID=UPI0023499080|nr:ferritin-like domain-containing protein [Paucibacter sp. XJ19-41]MDC6169782.1 ferritin-like domain-containing protein [Paucibacter sp. XJ19-41]